MKTIDQVELEKTFGERLVTLHTGATGLRGGLQIKATPDPDDEDLLTMRASDETLDRYQEIISAAGWKLDTYRKNPVIQNAHNYWTILDTIGRAEVTTVVEGALMQVWRFATKENPLAKVARDLYRGGFLHASSVGFIPVKWENGTPEAGFRRKYLEQELLEVSAVSVPANPNALQLALREGAVETNDLRALADFLKPFCNEEASPRTDPAARRPGTDGAELLRLARALSTTLRRA